MAASVKELSQSRLAGLPRAPGQLQDVAEDQLPLAAGVGGADQLVGGAEEALDDRELLARPLLVDRLELEPLGDDRERRQRPLLQGRVVVLRLLRAWPGAPGPR